MGRTESAMRKVNADNDRHAASGPQLPGLQGTLLGVGKVGMGLQDGTQTWVA